MILVLLLLLLTSPVHAAVWWESVGPTGKPDLDTIHQVRYLHEMSYTSLGGWNDPTAYPPDGWIASAVAAADPYVMHETICFDLEAWPVTTQEQRIATAAKFVQFYNEVKALRPNWKIGFYSFIPLRNSTDVLNGSAHASYQAWQAANDDMQPVADVVDFLAPEIYSPGYPTYNSYRLFAEGNISEANRLAANSGRNIPVYPFIWYRNSGDTVDNPVDLQVNTVLICLEQSDGLIVWSKYADPWDEHKSWWQQSQRYLPMKPRSARQ